VNRERDRDRAALPEPMRNDVRLLGDILGEVIRDSAGPDLFADVERLRHAVIDARHGSRSGQPANGQAANGQAANGHAGSEPA
jgi:phosphoenolpyruvate carboxylase